MNEQYPTWQQSNLKPDEQVSVIGEDIVEPEKVELTQNELELIKDKLTTVYENIKARLKELLSE